jgi:hypothetical protein
MVCEEGREVAISALTQFPKSKEVKVTVVEIGQKKKKYLKLE